MCGIVGLFLKDRALEPELGRLLSEMLVSMTDRGPDSAGIAVYGPPRPGAGRLTLQSPDPEGDFATLATDLATDLAATLAATLDADPGGAPGTRVTLERRGPGAVLHLPDAAVAAARAALPRLRPGVRVTGAGRTIEIFKDVGRPADVAERFGLAGMTGSHGIGHTRMATESAVTTDGAHPFSTGPDQCLVHNGSLSNHNNVRRRLRHAGLTFQTDNDSEVAAAYLTHRMAGGCDLGAALEHALHDLDGFYTFVVGTADGFGVLRDAIACKPAVMAETDAWVAFGSEYRALAALPGIDAARVWEPEPATVYFWRH
ncbi:class II glutamine amidotransferase [Rhodobaculum claviforme]|uniref:Glutamine amidotransferase n=1 Tax=Rhodobaculum claviforme TaxID=1549854 RepID=A0A934TKE2_9RHOB|nr:glutamine amidotransferase family protein [Rhodobaculum claviforme]MBK5927056.1 glutamine amidotransferase [Rhodobaculum claviforme]